MKLVNKKGNLVLIFSCPPMIETNVSARFTSNLVTFMKDVQAINGGDLRLPDAVDYFSNNGAELTKRCTKPIMVSI